MRVSPQRVPKGAPTQLVPYMGGRIKGRAFCGGCLKVASSGVSGLAGGMVTNFGHDPSPWDENTTRSHEDGQP